MRLCATRDSVAAADDVHAPHKRMYSFADSLSPLAVVARIVADGYLAKIAGGKATWSAASGLPVAVVAQQWGEPRGVALREPAWSDLEQRDGMYRMHFNYHAQRDPEAVLAILKELRLHAP
jgi:hypothetical protein